LPYRIITDGGAPHIHHARSAKAALGYALVQRTAHPDMSIMTEDGVLLTMERLRDLVTAEENARVSQLEED
jgi:hypothetical protein